ncbi:hypothetical protein BGZ96_009286 [Linnemannia gamsii]|uniref:FAD-binding domain-containing protein n=1 Tax=Linnemannia gamsii TaxID=64522 RepID=A0ABQ7JWH5_9FUNG|nr:hypothetical protein BGZ96_009286 [Linnemannia gamsii]
MPFSTHPRVKTRPSFSSSASPNDLDSASISSGSTHQQHQHPLTPLEDYPDLKPLPKSHAPMACMDPALAIPFDLSILTISHKKDHNAVKAVIVGGGIAGLSLAIMMAKAGIEYIILERSTGLEPSIGSGTVLGPPVLRLIEQIGLLPQVEAASKVLSGLTLADGESRKIGRIDSIDQDRYGYPLRLIARQDLHRILLDHVPKEHIQHGKLVVETLQNPNGASCKCSDGSTYYGDIIVGADGSHSLTRDRMYTHLRELGKLTDADMEPSCYEHLSIGGTTRPLDKGFYPGAHEPTAEMHAIYTKDAPYSFWYMPVGGSRVAWGIINSQSPKHKIHNYSKPNHTTTTTTSSNANNPTTTTTAPHPNSSSNNANHVSAVTSSSSSNNSSNSSSFSSHVAMIPALSGSAANFVTPQGGAGFNSHTSGLAHSGYIPNKSSNAIPPPLSRTSSAQKIHDDWFVPGSVDLEIQFKDLLNVRCAIGVGTIRDLIANTPKGTMFTVDVEERLNKTWHHGRIVLIGDACHQLLPIGGQGAVQGMLDSVCLVNLLYDMEFNTPSEIAKVFKKYQAKRSSLAKATIDETSQFDKVFHSQGLMAEMKRKFILNAFSSNMKNDKLNNNRPQLSFLPFVEDRGASKANRQKISGRLLANNKTFAV